MWFFGNSINRNFQSRGSLLWMCSETSSQILPTTRNTLLRRAGNAKKLLFSAGFDPVTTCFCSVVLQMLHQRTWTCRPSSTPNPETWWRSADDHLMLCFQIRDDRGTSKVLLVLVRPARFPKQVKSPSSSRSKPLGERTPVAAVFTFHLK